MQTAFDLPSDLVHAIKLRAVHENRRFKEVAAESLCSAIGQGKSPIPLPQKGPIKLPPLCHHSRCTRISNERHRPHRFGTDPTTRRRPCLPRLVPTTPASRLRLHSQVTLSSKRARAVFESADSCQPAAFCRATQASFLRLLTVKSIRDAHGCDPIPNSKAWAKCAELLRLPQVTCL